METKNILEYRFKRRYVLRCDLCKSKDYTETYYSFKDKEFLDCCLDKTMRVIDVKYKEI